MKLSHKILLGLGWLVLGAAAVLVPQAAAAACSGPNIMFAAQDHCGYFDQKWNPPGTGLDVYDGGLNDPFGKGVYVNTPNELISIVRQGVNSGNDHYRNSSKFLVLAMLGFNQGVARSQVFNTHPTRCPNVDCIDEWENRIRMMSNQGINGSGTYYGPNGKIDFHRNYLLDCGTVNTIYQNWGSVDDDVAPYVMKSGNSNCSNSYIQDHVVFFDDNNNVIFRIRRDCANPVGDLPGLPEANYEVNLSGTTTTPTIVAGGTGVVRVAIRNTGPSWSEKGQLWISYPGNVSTPGTQTALTGGWETARGWNPPDHWYWHTDYMDPNMAQSSATLSVVVNPATPVGTILTFVVTYKPADDSGATKTDIVTMRVVALRSPGVIGRNGDTHAGGGIGDNCAPSSGFVQGNANGASYTEYVVSASAVPGISSFRSNGAAGSDTLKLGSNGGYATICRPDIYQAAQDYKSGGGTGYVTRGPGPLDLSSFNPLPGVETVFVNGDVQVFGTVSRKLTIIADGTVTITGNITLTGASFGAHDVPSLGIASNGPIEINHAVTRVDAYLFSNDVIDTCREGQIDTTGTCFNVLTVNGFLMGRDIKFRRTGPFNGSAQNGQSRSPGEIVALIPQLYLNPPKFFDSSVDDRLLEGQGERQPLF